jgi:hypothetical protein
MRNIIKVVLEPALTVTVGGLLIAATAQQNEEPNASQQQQSSPQSQASSNAAVQSVTGCVVQSDHGYSLKSEDGSTYPIETEKDLSQYVNKEVRVTGILEHHNASTPSASAGSPATITDIRLRMVATVIGDCAHSQK